jgi:hypothetical protein
VIVVFSISLNVEAASEPRAYPWMDLICFRHRDNRIQIFQIPSGRMIKPIPSQKMPLIGYLSTGQ